VPCARLRVARVRATDKGLALVVVVLWGLNFIAIDIGLRDFPPLLFAALRFAVIAVPTVLLVPRPRLPWRWLLGYGIGFGAVQFAFLFVAIDAGMPAGLASLVLQASAPMTVVLGAVLLAERLTPRQVAGVLLAVGGMTVIGSARAQSAALVPFALTLVAAAGWAMGNLCSRLARPESPFRLVLWMSVVPPLPLLAVSLAVEGVDADLAALRAAAHGEAWAALGALLYIVVLATLVGSGLWATLLKRHPASAVAPYSLLIPVVGMTAAWAVLGERPSELEVLGGVVVALGVLLGTTAGRRDRAVVLP
jgi:O-acetylserine/cysteine efflux transporter